MTVLNVSELDFQTEVLDRSHEVPVVVDFWADWCGPCKALGPILERLASEADGRWVLAKVDVDANQQLAAAARVQSIPAVKAFRDGKIVAEFVGALPEDQVRAWLTQLGPTAGEELVGQAAALEASGDLAGALGLYEKAEAVEPRNGEARSGVARLQLVERSQGAGDEKELRARLDEAPGDISAAISLADILAAAGRHGEAFEVLIDMVARVDGDPREAVRKHLLSLLETIPPDDPRAAAARRALALVLF